MPLLLGQPQFFFEALQLVNINEATKISKKPTFKNRFI
jgi:hypothetical protein